MSILKNILTVLYPKRCVLCDEILIENEDTMCLHCINNLPFTNITDIENNVMEKVFSGKVPIKEATSLLFFSKHSSTQKLIHLLKYKNHQVIGSVLGNLLGTEIKESNRFKKLDGIIIVPLHPKKFKKRGYNQLSTFAAALSKILNIPIFHNVLVKTDNTQSQTKKNRLKRFDDIQEKFHLQNGHLISNKNVLLLDDVMTTGATLEVCTSELLKEKNVTISIATMAMPFV